MDRRLLPALVSAAGMIATPLRPQAGRHRRWLSSAVVGGLAATTAAGSARTWGGARTGLAAGTIAVGTAAIERIGTATGVPFGKYRYTGALQPEVGGVPVLVPLAWFAMALPARDTAHAALGSRSTALTRIVGGAAALTAWDLFLDPQMVGEDYWRWASRGRYRGIPFTNFVGWFLTGLAVMGVLERTVPVGERADVGLIAEYSTMAVMETLGFAAFFRDRVVALIGGTAMLPVSVLAIRRLRWHAQ